jgi:hypothetical protein
MQRRDFLAVATVALGLCAGWAQAAPNLSGTWVLDKDKSDSMRPGGPGAGGPGAPAGVGAGTPGAAPGGPGGPPRDVTLVIKQSENELAVTQKTVRDGQDAVTDQKFSLDGKENSNPMPAGRGGQSVLKSKAKWDKEALVIEGSSTVSTPDGEREIKQKLEYSLSADGHVLTLQRTRSGRQGQGDFTVKQVFNKQ